MKRLNPLVLVLAGQMIILVGAVAVFAMTRSSEAHSKTKKVAHAESPEDDEVDDAPPARSKKPKARGHSEAPEAAVDDEHQHHAKAEHGEAEVKGAHGQKPATGTAAAGKAAHDDTPAEEAAVERAGKQGSREQTASEEEVAPLAAVSEKPTLADVVSALSAGNARFVEGAVRQRDAVALRRQAAQAERPEALIISCLDGRVVPELIFDAPVGSFVSVRTPAAQVDEQSASWAAEALERLSPAVVIVLGHQGCHHLEAARKKAGSKAVAKPTSLTSAIAGTTGAEVVTKSLDFSVAQLRRRVAWFKKHAEVPVLRVAYDPDTGAVTWLDASERAEAPEPAPRHGRNPH